MTAAQFDPVIGGTTLALFGEAKGPIAYLSGPNLQAGLLSALYQAEMLAASAGVVPFFDAGNGEKGVAVLGGARDKLANAPESVRTLYLAAHGAARQAQAHAREASPGVPLSARVDRALVMLQQSISFPPLAVVVVVTVLGVAAIVSAAWFGKGVAERIVQTHADDLRATYAIDQASKIAATQIAAGQTPDPGVWEVFKTAAAREASAPVLVPAVALGGLALLAGALFLPSLQPARGHA